MPWWPQKIEARVEELLTRFAGADLSVADVLCDAHDPDGVAFRVVDSDLAVTELTFGELRESSERMAAALHSVGVEAGDRVATLMGKSVDYLVTVLGIWRLGAVHVPLFTAFAPAAIAVRLEGSNAKVVVSDALQLDKLSPGPDIPTDAPWQVVVAAPSTDDDVIGLPDLLGAQNTGFPAARLGGEAPIIQIYTSGTTGNPKGVVIPARALASFQAYMEFGLGVTEDDVFWCAADPGWAYGLYYAVIGPMTLGSTSLLLASGFTPELTWDVMDRFGVTNFAGAPTVYRALRASGIEPGDGVRLRTLSSAGEPLTPDINRWTDGILGIPVHDHYGQTEAGMMVNNHHADALQRPVKEGSMGLPMPGWSVRVLDKDRDVEVEAGIAGRIAVDLDASPLAWFTGYHEAPEATADRFSADGRWYLTGDSGAIDEDGYVHFMSRDDDVIIMAGYRIGPFEVESVLVGHPDVIEAAAIAIPDEVRGEALEAHIVLRDGAAGTDELAGELQQLVKDNLAAHAYPRSVVFTDALPKTPSGKVQRFVLRRQRQQELETGR